MKKINKKHNTKNNITHKNAFTIIEVVLVLAIAGLIFLIVFLALPGLQRSRRDTQRKSDFNSMVAALEGAASVNGGKYPENTMTYVDNFLPGFTPTTDPQGTIYSVISTNDTPFDTNPVTAYDPALWNVNYQQGGTCNNNVATAPTSTVNVYKYAISMVLENGAICKQV